MKKALLLVACLGTVVTYAQIKDSLQTQDVEEVVLTASRKKKISKKFRVLLPLWVKNKFNRN